MALVFLPTITRDTKTKEGQLRAQGKEIPWDKEVVNPEENLRRTYQSLMNPGIDLLAQQPYRTARVERPRYPIVKTIYELLEEQHNLALNEQFKIGKIEDPRSLPERLGLLIVNMDIPGVEDLSNYRDFNLSHKYNVSYLEAIKFPDLLAKTGGIEGVDPYVCHVMKDAA